MQKENINSYNVNDPIFQKKLHLIAPKIILLLPEKMVVNTQINTAGNVSSSILTNGLDTLKVHFAMPDDVFNDREIRTMLATINRQDQCTSGYWI